MSLSNYQGSYMTIHYARRKSVEGGLSKKELIVLREKAKTDPKAAAKLRRYRGESFEGTVVETKNNKKIIVGKLMPMTKQEKLRERRIHGKSDSETKDWQSMQERTNNLSLELLRLGKKKTDV